MCQARVLTTSFKIPSAAEGGETHVVWRTTVCGAKTDRTVTTDDGDSTIPICSACVKRYVTKHKEESKWYGWFDGDVPSKAPIFDSKWFWWRVYNAWVAQAPFEDKTRQVTRKELMDFIRPSMFLPKVDAVAELTAKLSSCSIDKPKQTYEAWLETAEGKAANMKQKIQKRKELLV